MIKDPVSIRRELFEDLFIELPELWRAHYEEIASNKDKVPLSPDVFSYITYERGGRLVILAARDGKRLVGYSFFVLQFHLHYKELSVAVSDLFYVRPEYRGRFLGSRLIDAGEAELKKLGIRLIQMRHKKKHDFGLLLERKGYEEEEIVHRKYIGD